MPPDQAAAARAGYFFGVSAAWRVEERDGMARCVLSGRLNKRHAAHARC
jgi:hypothetical protein